MINHKLDAFLIFGDFGYNRVPSLGVLKYPSLVVRVSFLLAVHLIFLFCFDSSAPDQMFSRKCFHAAGYQLAPGLCTHRGQRGRRP